MLPPASCCGLMSASANRRSPPAVDEPTALAGPVFAVLHGVRLKEDPTVQALVALLGSAPHDIGAALQELARSGDVEAEAGGDAVHWRLTSNGQRRHAAELAARRRPNIEAVFALARDTMAGSTPDPGRGRADLAAMVRKVRPVLAEAGAFEPRLLQYLARLESAVSGPATGGSADTVMDVWTECLDDLALLAWC